MRELVNNAGQVFVILDEFKRKRNKGKGSHDMMVVLFPETGTTKTVYKSNADKGKVNDPHAASVLGKGYNGFFNKNLPYWKQAKQLWRNMLKRCYNPNDKHGYYGTGVYVSERWLSFENFLNDISSLPNFDKWLTSTTDYHLDKDLLVQYNKVYSNKTCQFVEASINKADGATRGKPYTRKGR